MRAAGGNDTAGSADLQPQTQPVDCSDELAKVGEPECFNDVRLNRSHLRIHGVGSESAPHHGARRPCALWLRYELRDRLGDVMRVRCACRLEQRHEVLEECSRNLSYRTVRPARSTSAGCWMFVYIAVG